MVSPAELSFALGEATAGFPSQPRVVGVRSKIGPDSQGKEAVYVWVVLADETPHEQLRHANFQPAADEIRAAIARAFRGRVSARTYVSFRLKAEQDQIDAAGAA